MSTSREQFLHRVREAVAEGNRAGGAPALPERGSVGYQGAGADAVQRFCAELAAAGGVGHVVATREEALAKILELVQQKNTDRILLGRGRYLDALDAGASLRSAGNEVLHADEYTLETRDQFFAANIGISAVEYLIAETGTVVVTSGPDDPRSVSLLPPVHIAVAHREQLLPDLFDLFEAMQEKGLDALPAGMALITGPSKTGDIELKLVTGVHGPGEVHVVLGCWP